MAYTYLITGATSDVGRDLIERMLAAQPDGTVLAQGCGDVEKLAPLIEGGKVFVNGRLVTSNAYLLRDQDLVSVRGYGKFRFLEPEGQTRKGRYFTRLERFV